MSEQITVTLPDGSTKQVAPGTTAAEVAASIGAGLAKAAIAAKADGEWIDLDRPARARHHAPDRRPRHRTTAARCCGTRPRTCWPKRSPAVPRREVRDRSRDHRRLLLRLRAARTARRSPKTTWRRIEAEMRKIVKADQRFVRDELSYDDALQALRRPAVQARDHREGARRRCRRDEDAGEVGGDARACRCTAT